jgi:uncharacterized repeat protein (TIGR01451 family)
MRASYEREVRFSVAVKGIAVRKYVLAAIMWAAALSAAPSQTLPPLDKPGAPVATSDLPLLGPNSGPVATSEKVPPTPKPESDPPKPPVIGQPPQALGAPLPNALPALSSSSSPVVTVELIGPEAANVGRPTAFELVVRNLGKSPVYQLRLEQELPPGIRCLGADPQADLPGDRLIWNLGILDAGAEKRVKMSLQSSSEGEVCCKATATYSTACVVTTRFARRKLSIAISGPESATVGDPVNFQIHVSNNGSAAIGKLLLRDLLPAGLSHPQGNTLEAEIPGLAAGETRMITLKTTAAKAGHYTNEIQAIAEGPSTGPIRQAGTSRHPDSETSARAEIRIVAPGLQIHVNGPKSCLVKCEAVFSIDLTNPGAGPAKNVRIANRIPDGLEFVAVSDDGVFDPTSRSVNWSLPVLEAGGHKVVTVKVRGSAIIETTSVVLAIADGNLNARAETPVKVEGIPALSLEVVDLDDPAPVGTDLTYEIRVLNQGTCPCTGIQIVGLMPEGMELREASAPTPYKIQGQQVQFAAHTKLGTKADLVYRLKVRSKLPGDVRFRVQLTCDQLQQPVFKEESTRFFQP